MLPGVQPNYRTRHAKRQQKKAKTRISIACEVTAKKATEKNSGDMGVWRQVYPL
jgi:hypothetical protein